MAESAQHTGQQAKQGASETGQHVKESGQHAAQKGQEMGRKVGEQVGQKSQEAVQKGHEVAQAVGQKAQQVGHQAQQMGQEAGKTVDSGISSGFKNLGMNIKSSCPNCSNASSAPPDENVICPHCRTMFHSPTVGERVSGMAQNIRNTFAEALPTSGQRGA